MSARPSPVFKIVTDPDELEQVYRLNYDTFVEEIPQHAPNAEGRLVDPLLARSTCYACMDQGELIGMVVVGGRRPFSLDKKLDDLDRYLPEGSRPCEIRLLAVKPNRRQGRVFIGLMRCVLEHCDAQGYDLALCSAAASQARMYRHAGCEAFGPPLGTPEAPFQGMYISRRMLSPVTRRLLGLPVPSEADSRSMNPRRAEGPSRPINLLPGPVKISPAVHAAFCEPAISHRSRDFQVRLGRVVLRLRELCRVRHVTLLLGSGTLANDAVAVQLKRAGPGLILSNGHFGWRLTDHARRAGLQFETLEADWGQPLPYAELAERLSGPERPDWLWAVLHETSTGVLNDLHRLSELAESAGTRLCIDAISAIGAAPVDLSRAHLATGVSGKALAAYPGLAFVLHRDRITPDLSLPRYLDLGLYADAEGVPYTSSSNLLAALDVALDRLDGEARREQVFAAKRQLARDLRRRVEAAGFAVMAPEAIASPAIQTLRPPPGVSAQAIGEGLDAAGIFLSYRSGYLQRRNLVQVCLFSDHDPDEIEALLPLLTELTSM